MARYYAPRSKDTFIKNLLIDLSTMPVFFILLAVGFIYAGIVWIAETVTRSGRLSLEEKVDETRRGN